MTGCYRTAGTMNLLYVLNTPALTSLPHRYERDHLAGHVSADRGGQSDPGGTALQNGAALLAALSGISGASATNPYLLKIEPGVYDMGSNGLSLLPYVDVEGSGEGVTTSRAATPPPLPAPRTPRCAG